ncbi:M48 family metallopeptidase [Veronia pacifica]|uniref:Zn-dependent protease n=1 Tax=Veronia pacifica TaxID=1080227 RepID=A0A1C3EG76_9GAMM|nr:M48 family metallopeptidase [Veronia pacifica]ODA32223.1 Zn-dependent protease [Veronia pacifica]
MKRRQIMTMAVVGMMCLMTACATSPTGRKQFIITDSRQMAAMGLQAFDELKKKEKISTDKKTIAYVNCVTNALLRVVPPQPEFKEWEVVVFDSKQVNAFALPGGKIGVYTGLLDVATTQDQLAAVIGHEIGHVLANHGAERVSQSIASNSALQIASVSLDGEYKAQILSGLGLGLKFGVMLPFSRAHETESDLIGLKIMNEAGFKPSQSVRLWQNMAKASKGAPPELLSTHPSSSTRINDLRSAMTTLTSAKYDAPKCRR